MALMKSPDGREHLDITAPGIAAMKALGWTEVEDTAKKKPTRSRSRKTTTKGE